MMVKRSGNEKTGDGGGRRVLPFAILAGLAVYVILFLACPLDWASGHRFTRGGWVAQWLLLPDEMVGLWLDSPSDLLLLDRLLPLAVSLAILAVAGMLGYLGLVALRVDAKLTVLEQCFFAASVGLNLVSTYTLAVGLFGGLHNRLWFIAPAIVVAVGFGWCVRRQDRTKGCSLPGAWEPPQSELSWLNSRWLWVGGVFAVLILLGGLLPPNEFDVREYHLQAPKEFYQAGRVEFLPHNVYGNMAMGAEMHALLGMVLLGDWWMGALVGKAILALCAPLTALGLLAAGQRLFTPAAGILAAVFYLSIPLVANICTFGFIEAAAALYLFATLYAMLIAKEDQDSTATSWILPGYLAGAAVACKYPGLLFVVAPLGAWLLWISWNRRDREGRRRPQWAAPVVFAGAVAAGCGLWLAKNWVLAGNPVYPLLYGLFGGRTLTAEKSQMWRLVHKPAGFTFSALSADAWRVLIGSDWLSPILIPMAALAFVKRQSRLVLGFGLYFLFLIAAWWMFALRIDRFWMPALPFAAILAGVGATWCRDRLWQYSLLVLFVFSLVCSFVTVAVPPCVYTRFFVPYAKLRTSPDRLNPWHTYLNEHVDGTLLLVGEAQVFDLEVPILYNAWLDDSVFESIVRDPVSGRLRPADEISAELKARNVSHVYVSWSEIARYRDTGYGNWDFVRPEVFEQLVREGVLEWVPPPKELEGSVNQVYRVVSFEL